MDYEQYEKESKKIRIENEGLLRGFKAWLEDSGLLASTVEKHINNVDFYVNEFLLYQEAIPARDGIYDIGMFLGYWFIRKAMWSSVTTIKQNAASLKKFYKYMLEKGEILETEYESLTTIIKEEMPEWLATMQRYLDPDIKDYDDVFLFDDI